ncbi:DEKNAAC101546 [Brettanomyces naardenensis]|uniref:DEKNAAC101546 n=1 Tax=Brettanomyces naardenensis TaxID=13370 RepID=A0A448YIB5_BRENA|nr:DEKNAAC101546 [Brettanomyces naardenensis]
MTSTPDISDSFTDTYPPPPPPPTPDSISNAELEKQDASPGTPRNWFQRQFDSFKPAQGDAQILQPQLSAFALQMIAIGGSIGTGLFIGSGQALAEGGAAGLLICYTLVSILIYFMMQCLSELAVTFPVPGAFSHYASRFIDTSWGFAIGWNYFMQWLILLPLELSAASMTFRFWGSLVPEGWLITIFFILIIVINMMPVKVYGYAEIIFSLSKVIAIIGFLIFGSVILFGGIPGVDPVLDKYWKDPGPFTPAGFKGILSVFVTASFSFSGTEMCGLCAAETPNPRKTIPKASRQVFWRILLFYISTLILVGLLVPYNDPKLVPRDEGNAVNSSPLVLALAIAEIPWLPSVMNVVILVSIISVGNSAIYAASRTMVSLTQRGIAPKIFGYMDRCGRPLMAILLTLSVGCLSYLSLIGDSAHTVFTWLLALSGLSSIFTWSSICLSMILFRRSMKSQGRSLTELGYLSNSGLFGAWFGFLFCIVILVAQVWIAISPPIGKTGGFLYALKICLGGFVVLGSFLGHKLYLRIAKGSFQFGYKPEEIDLISGRTENDIEGEGLVYESERIEAREGSWYYRTLRILGIKRSTIGS